MTDWFPSLRQFLGACEVKSKAHFHQFYRHVYHDLFLFEAVDHLSDNISQIEAKTHIFD
jgi:hypothetical protein